MSHESPVSMPLEHKTVLVACSAQKAEPLILGLERLGARVIPFPVIEIRALADPSPIDDALDAFEQYSWIIFTSSYGVFYFLRRMEQRGFSMDRWKNRKVCAVGPATAQALADSGVEVSLVPKEYVAEGILRTLAEFHGGLEGLAGSRILLPRAKEARELLPRELSSAGARVDVVPCYETVLPEVEPLAVQQILKEPPALLVFTSSSTVNNFVLIMGREAGKQLLRKTAVASLGPITAQTAAALGKQVEILPRENTTSSLLEAIADYYS